MSTKISQLTSAADITASDLMQIVDVEDGVMAPSGTNKKITAQLLADDLAGIVSAGSIATSKLASGALPSGVTVSSTNIVNGTIVDADVSASAAIAGSKISPNFTTNTVLTVDSSPAISVISTADTSTQPAFLQFRKYRGTHESPTSVQNGDAIGSSSYLAYDGTSLLPCAGFTVTVDGVVSTGVTPTRMTFATEDSSGVSSERVRITPDGNVGIGSPSPSSKLHVAGDLTMSSATVATSATAGTNGDVPAQVAGYLVVNINGTARKIPYYA